jgi:hypothetical protein
MRLPRLACCVPALALGLLFIGCPLVIGVYDDDTTTGDDDDDDVDWGEVVIDQVTPAAGGTEGGDQVEIHGENLGAGGLEVRFGDESAAILSIDDEHLSVTSPRAGEPGAVDVVVTHDLGQDTREGGYVYEWTGEDQDGGRVMLFHNEIPSLGDVSAQALARIYAPDDWGFLDHLPANGACGFNIESPVEFYDYLEAGASVSLQSTLNTIELGQSSDESGGPIYEENNAQVQAVEFNSSYDLVIPGGVDLPGMTIPQAIATGADFVVFDPDINDPSATPMWTRNPGATLQWTSGGGAGNESRMMIHLVSVDPNGNPTGGNLTCTSNDGGGYVFGPVELAYLEAGINYLYVTRYDIDTWQNPFNGSDGHGVFAVTKIGVIVLVD